MLNFKTKNPNLGIFLLALEGKIWLYFMAILVLVSPFVAFYLLLVYFVVIWYIFSHFGMLHQEKSGNPGLSEDGATSDLI
jgi:hypothetical protein